MVGGADDTFLLHALDERGGAVVTDLQAALEYLQRSYEKLPEADVAAHLGEVLWAKGRRDDAMLVFRAGLAKDAQNRTLQETIKRLGVVLP